MCLYRMQLSACIMVIVKMDFFLFGIIADLIFILFYFILFYSILFCFIFIFL